MGASKADVVMSSKGSKVTNGDYMDLDDDTFADVHDVGIERLNDFCKKASSSFFAEYGLISHQLNSYNDFIKNGVQQLFDSLGDLSVGPDYDPSKKLDGEWRFANVKFGKVTIGRPKVWAGDIGERFNQGELDMHPKHARLQNLTYSSKMVVNVQFQVYTKQVVQSDKFKTGKDKYVDMTVIHDESKDVMIGKIPVMVKSDLCSLKEDPKGECVFDHGGYFIIKGAEKVFIAQEQICLKRLWISGGPNWTAAYRSKVKREMVYAKLIENSKYENIQGGERLLTAYIMGAIEIPIWILFFALGVTSDKEVMELIGFGGDDARVLNIIFASIHAADGAYERSGTARYDNFRRDRNAFAYVAKEFKNSTHPFKDNLEEGLTIHLFPNIPDFRQKARMLGYMVKCLLQAYTGHRKCENRDDFRNKRLDLAGELLERELRAQLFSARRRMLKAIQKDLYGDRMLHSIDYYFDASIISNGLLRAFSTGAWSNYTGSKDRITGVVTTLKRTNPLQTTGETRKMRQQVKYTGKVGDARYPHPSHWGRICYISTRDGEDCGLVKNIAALGLVSTHTWEPLVNALVDSGMERLVCIPSTALQGKYKIFLNGEWVGVCGDSHTFVAELRNKRRRKELPSQVEIKRDGLQEEVRIFSDAGRLLRPLLVVENLKKIKEIKENNYSFTTLLDQGVIELVGVEEEEDCLTAWSIEHLVECKPVGKYTHCELDMSFLLGLSCGIIPYANHDHARRVLYQSEKHSQQAIGFSTTNPHVRVDTNSHNLFYPQSPLFRTMISDCLGKPSHSLDHHRKLSKPEYYNGQVAIVSVNVHQGYNQEDSLVMNRSSLERGMFRSEHVRSYKAEVYNKEAAEKKKKHEDLINFGKIQSTRGCIDSLDDDGFPSIGAYLQSGDIVIGKCANSGDDHSVKLKHTEKGRVQKVVLSANDEGKNFAVVSLRQVRSPCLGDKFSSMHGQKGVLGLLDSQENFPFTLQGIVPDIVLNPHAFPARQTPGQLLESALGKGIALGGLLKSATPFSAVSSESIRNQLHRLGFTRWGNERVYDGRTGEKVDSLIFIGPTFYQRLTHMAEDKVKFRNTGPVHPLTRQPVADRKRFGGIKFGEMERDCLIAHGASANLHERLFTLSDSSQMHICQRCKNIANVMQRTAASGRKIRGPYCRFCESVDEIIKVNVPYGAKLLCQELFSMGISLKFDTRVR